MGHGIGQSNPGRNEGYVPTAEPLGKPERQDKFWTNPAARLPVSAHTLHNACSLQNPESAWA